MLSSQWETKATLHSYAALRPAFCFLCIVGEFLQLFPLLPEGLHAPHWSTERPLVPRGSKLSFAQGVLNALLATSPTRLLMPLGCTLSIAPRLLHALLCSLAPSVPGSLCCRSPLLLECCTPFLGCMHALVRSPAPSPQPPPASFSW